MESEAVSCDTVTADNSSLSVDGNAPLEWQQTGLRIDACLASRDFEAVAKLGERLCSLRPQAPRGWITRLLALLETADPDVADAAVSALLEDALNGCSCEGNATVLKDAMLRTAQCQKALCSMPTSPPNVQVFNGEWDAEGVFVYQAFCDTIADWALTHQQFGGPDFNTTRMTWVKPSFGWVLYRSGYGHKPNQNRVLKVKLPHDSMAQLLSCCQCVDTNKATRSKHAAEQSGNGRVQWDPERDMLTADGREPRELRKCRAIQIGLKGKLSDLYVKSVISIQDVTALCHRVCEAHRSKKQAAMAEIHPELPVERPYMPQCSESCLIQLGMLPGPAATAIAQLGRGKAS